MGPVEIVIIVAAVALVISVVTVAIARKLKGKPSGCSGCAGCPYAGSCKGGEHTSCHDTVNHDTAKDIRSISESCSCDE